MYICNMLYSKGKDTTYRNGRVKIEGMNEPIKGYIGDDEGQIGVFTEPLVEDIFYMGMTSSGETLEDDIYRSKVLVNGRRAGKLTYKNIKDTIENPLVVVVCKTIGIYEGAEANVRVLPLGKNNEYDEDVMLAMLVSGVCEFDGVPMQRCDITDFEKASARGITTYDADKLRKTTSHLYTEGKTGYDYSEDVVMDLIFRHTETGFTIKGTVAYWLDKSGYDKAVAVQAEREERRRLKKEEEHERRAELSKKAKEQKEAELREQEEKKKERSKVGSRKGKVVLKDEGSKETKVLEGSEGATAFLAAVASLSGR